MVVGQMLQRAVKYFPQKTATVCGDSTLSYQELQERVNRLSNGLANLGVGKGDRVAALMLNCHRYLELYYATALLGAFIVPLNFRLAGREIAYIMNDSESKVLFLHDDFLPLFDSIKDELGALERVVYVDFPKVPQGSEDYEELLSQSPSSPCTEDVSEDDPAGLFYTSGTTGNPKGVILTHRNLVSNAYHGIIAIGWGTTDSYLHACPMFHLADGPSSHALTWVAGTHVFMRSFDAKQALETIEEKNVTVSTFIPTMINFIVNHPDVAKHDLSSLKKVVYGGSPMPVELLRTAIPTLKCDFFQAYGLTETAPLLTILRPDEHVTEGPEKEVNRLASCGRALVGIDLKVIDDAGEEVQPGQVGEIIARGPNIMKGYWNKPEETADAIRDGWFHTGDLATVDEDGYVFIVDRKKDMIISGGENVFSTEVENVLYSHPAILEAAVIGVPDTKWGEVIKAVVVLKDDAKATEQDIVEHCRNRIAHFKAPRSVDFYDGELPKSGSGKILKKELREKYWEGYDRKVH